LSNLHQLSLFHFTTLPNTERELTLPRIISKSHPVRPEDLPLLQPGCRLRRGRDHGVMWLPPDMNVLHFSEGRWAHRGAEGPREQD